MENPMTKNFEAIKDVVLEWTNAVFDDDPIITSVECLNPSYGVECAGDWIYKIKYDKGRREAEVFHYELRIVPTLIPSS